MALIDCLSRILKSNVCKEGKFSDGHLSFKLKDRRANMEIRIIEAGDPILVMGIGEHGDSPTHLPCLKSEYNKICDYLIVIQINVKYYAIFVEMKKTMSPEKGSQQLMRSLPILEYIFSVCKIECETRSKISVKYALVAEKSADRFDKQPIRPISSKGTNRRYKNITIKEFVGRKEFPINILIT